MTNISSVTCGFSAVSSFLNLVLGYNNNMKCIFSVFINPFPYHSNSLYTDTLKADNLNDLYALHFSVMSMGQDTFLTTLYCFTRQIININFKCNYFLFKIFKWIKYVSSVAKNMANTKYTNPWIAYVVGVLCPTELE